MRELYRETLIDATRARLAPDLRCQFDALDDDAQEDIAVTLLWTTDQLPVILEPAECHTLSRAVQVVLESLTLSHSRGLAPR